MQIMEITDNKKIPIANPNPGRIYKDNIKGKEYIFHPLRKYLVDEPMAVKLLEQAEINRSNVAAQASAEMAQYRMLLARGEPFVRTYGSAYVEIGPNGEVSPKTKPYDFSPLVRLDTPAGQREYEAAIRYAVANNIDIPDTADDEPKSHINNKGDVSIIPVKKIEMNGPMPSWHTKRLVEWIKENGGSAKYTEFRPRLLRKAIKLHEARVALLRSVGVEVVDVGAEEREKYIEAEDADESNNADGVDQEQETV